MRVNACFKSRRRLHFLGAVRFFRALYFVFTIISPTSALLCSRIYVYMYKRLCLKRDFGVFFMCKKVSLHLEPFEAARFETSAAVLSLKSRGGKEGEEIPVKGEKQKRRRSGMCGCESSSLSSPSTSPANPSGHAANFWLVPPCLLTILASL